MGWPEPGGILDLWRVVHGHLPEVAADLRAFYGVSLWDTPLREVRALVLMLMRRPDSWLTAAKQGWERPVTYEWLAMADLIDVERAKGAKRRPRPYPRPIAKRAKLGGKKTVRRSPAEVLAILRPNRESPPTD